MKFDIYKYFHQKKVAIMRKMMFLSALLTLTLFVTVPVFGAIIFQDNFDNCSSKCNVSAGSDGPSGWSQWMADGVSATQGGITHYSGEISSPGRGGTGGSLKNWRYGTSWEGYAGSLVYNFGGSYHDIYIRYYWKIPVSMDFTSNSDYQKLWRLNMGSAEQYFELIGNRANAYVELYNASSGHIRVLDHATTMTLWDGNWHCIEIHLNNAATTAQVWLDGVLKYSSSSYPFEGTGAFTMMQHFSLGNHASGVTWQSSWQAMEFDDLVISTTYVGPSGEPVPTVPDTTAPEISNASPSGSQTCVSNPTSITLNLSTNEDATCKYSTTNVSYASMAGTFTTTGKTTHSQALSFACGSSYTYYVRCQDVSGNANTSSTSIVFSVANQQSLPTLLTEGFDDNSFASRGWFDDTSVSLDTSTKYSGSSSLKLAWSAGGTAPSNIGAMRKSFSASDTLYASMYWRFATGWVGSGQSYHPHLIYLLSDADDVWGGLAYNYLDTYIEVSNTTPRLIIQDGINVNMSYGTLPNDLTKITQNRDVAGCNGCLLGSDCGLASCYDSGSGAYWNGRTWDGSQTLSLNTWHKVETYFKMNTVSGGLAVADGIMQMWIDGALVIDKANIVYRTNKNPTLKWKTLVIAPWIGDGSPKAQTMWIDELTLAGKKPLDAPVLRITSPQ